MSGISLQLILFLLSSLSLVGLAFSGMLVSRAQRARVRMADRFAMVAAPHVRVKRIEISAFVREEPKENRSFFASVARLFNIDVERLHIYPVPWWLVLIVTAGAADVARLLCEGLLGSAALLTMPVSWVMLSRNFFGWADKRQRDKMLNQFPDALAMIVRSVRVGIPVMESMRAVAREVPEPTGPEFDRMVKQVAVGSTLEDAILEMARRSRLPEYRFFATALSLQTQTGGTLSETLENLADVIRKRMALKAKGYAMTSEVRTSTIVLAVMPAAVGFILWVMNPSYINVLFTEQSGHKIMGAAAISLATGLFVIRSIIRKVLP